ncbi:MAG TPA: ABC transporter ATP-binding protein, partial [Candidatus Competibacteraceae bacterium]|nr:ABC transporter ATP-binding protein [Candidatus Competibacteraceae bacterium]
LLDEPLSALDAHLSIRMQTVLTGLQKELGITFVYVTHSQSEAFAMADRVVIMSRGRVEQIGTPQEIYRRPVNRFVAEFIGGKNILSGHVRASGDGDTLKISSEHGLFELRAPHERKLGAGDRVTLCVSADRMHLGTQQTRKSNSLRCTVVGQEFVGSMITVYLESGTGLELKVQTPHSASGDAQLRDGDVVFVEWSEDDVLLLAEA